MARHILTIPHLSAHNLLPLHCRSAVWKVARYLVCRISNLSIGNSEHSVWIPVININILNMWGWEVWELRDSVTPYVTSRDNTSHQSQYNIPLFQESWPHLLPQHLQWRRPLHRRWPRWSPGTSGDISTRRTRGRRGTRRGGGWGGPADPRPVAGGGPWCRNMCTPDPDHTEESGPKKWLDLVPSTQGASRWQWRFSYLLFNNALIFLMVHFQDSVCYPP